MRENAVIDRIKELCCEYSWSYYRLAKESGIAYSTLSTMFRKTGTPSVETIEKICNAFGIPLSQFFLEIEEQCPSDRRRAAYLRCWEKLTPENQSAAEQFADYLLTKQSFAKKSGE